MMHARAVDLQALYAHRNRQLPYLVSIIEPFV